MEADGTGWIWRCFSRNHYSTLCRATLGNERSLTTVVRIELRRRELKFQHCWVCAGRELKATALQYCNRTGVVRLCMRDDPDRAILKRVLHQRRDHLGCDALAPPLLGDGVAYFNAAARIRWAQISTAS